MALLKLVGVKDGSKVDLIAASYPGVKGRTFHLPRLPSSENTPLSSGSGSQGYRFLSF